MSTSSKINLSICLFAFFLNACGSDERTEKNRNNVEADRVKFIKEKPVDVKVVILKEGTFNRELVANGRLEALRRANLKFSTDGVIKGIFVKENDRVANGQRLAILDNIQQQRGYAQNKLRYKQAVLDYEDQLLRLGYRLSDTTKIDLNTKNIARLRSGLSNIEIELQRSGTDLSYTTLNAPFPGKIANLKAKMHSGSSTFEYFCTLIDDSDLLVVFLILEQELTFLKDSKTIQVSPFNNEYKKYTGRVETINPMVDKSGMIEVKARIHNTDGQLLDGMSVKIIVQQAVPEQLSVPKNAVLDRQGRKVVFTTNDNKAALWNYVDIGYENSISYAIKSGLKSGEKVIYDGNFNLAHDKSIRVIN